MTPSQPRIVLEKSPDYRESYANSVQIRVNLWDFFLMFGHINQTSQENVQIQNFQGLFRIGNLQDALRSSRVAKNEILVALTGQRFRRGVHAVPIVRQADGLFAGKSRRFPDHRCHTRQDSEPGSGLCVDVVIT